MINARPTAASGTRTGVMSSKAGRIGPTAPRISTAPRALTKPALKSKTHPRQEPWPVLPRDEQLGSARHEEDSGRQASDNPQCAVHEFLFIGYHLVLLPSARHHSRLWQQRFAPAMEAGRACPNPGRSPSCRWALSSRRVPSAKQSSRAGCWSLPSKEPLRAGGLIQQLPRRPLRDRRAHLRYTGIMTRSWASGRAPLANCCSAFGLGGTARRPADGRFRQRPALGLVEWASSGSGRTR
jgi:hypothetical protein